MSGLWNWRSGRRTRLIEIALWSGATLTMVTAHVAGAIWLMREEPAVAADNAPPPAIMIEFADTPEATQTEETDISQNMQDSAQSAPSEKVDAPLDETPPEPEKSEPVIEEKPAEEETPTLQNVEVPLPVSKPKPAMPKKEIKKEEPKKKPPEKRRRQQQAASQQATKAQAQVTQSDRTAARQSASGLFSSSMTPARWQSRLMAHLERRKRYPSGARSRGEQGVVYVRFRIDDAGNVLSASLARSSGYPDLDNEVLSLVKRASPVPAPPPDVNKTITAPVKFDTSR